MTEPRKAFLQRFPLAMPIIVAIVAIYVGWIFYSRWNAAREAQRAAATREIERARKDVELNGGNQLKITGLYASPAVLHKGETVQICYGVVNAKSVAFEPPIDNVWPSMNRCVDVTPKKSTTYTLTADDGAGHSQTAQISLEVK